MKRKTKICTGCKRRKKIENFAPDTRHTDGLHSQCNLCRSLGNQKYRELAASKGFCVGCLTRPTRHNLRTCEFCEDVRRQKARSLRFEVFEIYGGAFCQCCREDTYEFLSIDHINNDGAVHKRQRKGSNLYQWLKRHNYPKGFQVLCMNCNFAKGRYGFCPHKTSSDTVLTNRKAIVVAEDSGQK
jgi:hypothetical protein